MRKSPFIDDKDAIFLKGNIHSHSTNSDGRLKPEEMIKAYKEHGYDFLAITDHDRYTDTRKYTKDDFTMIQGFELYANTTNDHDIHVNILFPNELNGYKNLDYIHLKERTGKCSIPFLYDLKEKGAYIMLNHPHWSKLTSPEIEDENPYDAVEIINYATEWLERTGDGSVFWTEMLYRGVKLWNGGSDDNHNGYEMDSMYCDSFGGYTVVKAKDRSPEAIMDAMKKGSFYTSTGPEIYEFYLDGDEIHIKCSPCERIFVCGEFRCFQRKMGRHVTEFVTKLKGKEKLIRCEVMDARGRSAYSNPIFLDK